MSGRVNSGWAEEGGEEGGRWSNVVLVRARGRGGGEGKKDIVYTFELLLQELRPSPFS